MHILPCSPIQDVKDRVPLGKQLHLTKRRLPSETVCLSQWALTGTMGA